MPSRDTASGTPSCATSSCHAGGAPPAGLNLEAANSYAMLVGIASSQDAGLMRVLAGDPDNSYLIHKLEGAATIVGVQMPPGNAMDPADIAVIRQWISDGAIDDTASVPGPISVASLSPAPGAALTTAPHQIIVGFDREVDASTVNAMTFIVEGSGGDGSFAEGNEVAITAPSIGPPHANPRGAVFDLSGVALADDTYRVRLLGNGAWIVMDLDANALEGGDFEAQFTLTTPLVSEPIRD